MLIFLPSRPLKFVMPELLSTDRKSTRLNSSHSQISYAVFCLKKKKNNEHPVRSRYQHPASKSPPDRNSPCLPAPVHPYRTTPPPVPDCPTLRPIPALATEPAL